MTTTEPRWRRRPESRRDELLAAARALFVEQGLESTTVADIVAAAGLAKGSFYRYFDSKDDLFTALKADLFVRMRDELVAAVVAALDTEVPPDADVLGVAALTQDSEQAGVVSDAVVDTAVRFLFAEREMIALWWTTQAHPRTGREAAWAQGIDGIVGLFAAAIADGVQRGVMDCADPPRTARMLVFAIHMATTHAVFYEREKSPDAVIDAGRRLSRRTLGLPDPPA